MAIKKVNVILLILAIPMLAMVVVCGGCLAIFNGVKAQQERKLAAMTPEERAAHDKQWQQTLAATDAEIAAKRVVTEFLKAPSTAQFDKVKVRAVGEHSWIVIGDVTAVNAFNAPIKNEFMITLWRPDGATGARDFQTGTINIGGSVGYTNPKLKPLIDADIKRDAKR